MLVDLANQLNWALRVLSAWQRAFSFSIRENLIFRTVTASFFTVHFSKLNYEHVVDLLRCSSTPSSLYVQFSLLNILLFHLFVDIILISLGGVVASAVLLFSCRFSLVR